MSQLSRNDVKTLALCLHNDATRHDADHDRIRSLINNIPCHLRDFKLANIIAEPRRAVKPCLVHVGIASLVVSYLFTSLQKQVYDSVSLLKKYGPSLGPEEIYLLERTITIEGMWSPPTTRTEPPKLRYWDYQVNKCQACMVARIASDPSALRDMRTLMLASINSSAKPSDPRLLPGHPTALSFINEWISLSNRSDELFYFSGIQAASIKAVKLKVEEVITAPSRCFGNKNFSYPQPPRTGYTPSQSSSQSTAIFTPTHTPESSTSSKDSSAFEWTVLTPYPTSNSSSQGATIPGLARGHRPGFSISSESSSIPNFLPFQKPCPVTSIATSSASTSLHSTYSSSLPEFGVNGFVERDTPTPRPPGKPENEWYGQKSFNGTRFAKPMAPTVSDRDSFTPFILRDSPVACQPPPLLSPRRTTPSRIVNPVLQWEDSGIGISCRRLPTQDESSRTFLDYITSIEGEHSQQGRLQEQKQSAKGSTIDLREEQVDEDDIPLISRWSTASSANTLSSLLKKTARGPRLGKVKTGKAIFKPEAEREEKKNKYKWAMN
ncbi:hypothetical protein PISL3812_08972 [Talaromyces islandicus]|uniref:Uncharacterized protein n=1 Tax=Talaromyces islandicus TaxID=28573 RepID=A0A0U1M8Q0_TALIS|nr:hypothetical protein PISL3812_08972 [Talaromyces islandicus]